MTTAGDHAALSHALYSLETRYWRDVDFNDGRDAHEFYTPDVPLSLAVDLTR